MTTEEAALSAFDSASHFIEVNASTIHYVESGSGNPLVFLHGMPTHSYLWRNIIPALSDSARCIAPDLIGMGRSGKPDIAYTIFDHIDYFDAFMEAMDLKDVTLVLHGWGSVVGFDYARRHPDTVKGIAFSESHVRPITDWDMLSLPVQQLATLLKRDDVSYRAVVEKNYLVNRLLPNGVLRSLSAEELDRYREPFPTEASRKPLWQYVQDLPLGEVETPVVELIRAYSEWLTETDKPKLMLYSIPGFITTIATVQWAKEHLSNLSLVELNDALHFAQESIPGPFREALREWYLENGF